MLQPGATLFGLFVMATAIVLLARPYVPVELLCAVYLLVIIPVAVLLGLVYGLAVAALSGIVCVGFFLPSDSQSASVATCALTFALFLGGALLGSGLGRSVRRRQERLARDQAALRHVAALVGRRVSPAEIFTTIAEEVARNSAADLGHIVRYESDASICVVASWGEGSQGLLPVGERIRLDGPCVEALVREYERPARIESFERLPGHIAEVVRRSGIRCEVGGPILMDGRIWGVMIVSSRSLRTLPADTEERISNFAELASIAVSHAETRTKLIDSRARLVASADEARERIERDLHDSVQQQLISAALRLHASQTSTDPQVLVQTLKSAEEALTEVIKEIRQIVHGLLPPVLTQAGLAPALRALARRFAFETTTHTELPERLAKELEAATYFVVSEALTNAAKHSHATDVHVTVVVRGGALLAQIKDNGIGGAFVFPGSGLAGLADRVEALGGWLSLESPPGEGTLVSIEFPLAERQDGRCHRLGRVHSHY